MVVLWDQALGLKVMKLSKSHLCIAAQELDCKHCQIYKTAEEEL